VVKSTPEKTNHSKLCTQISVNTLGHIDINANFLRNKGEFPCRPLAPPDSSVNEDKLAQMERESSGVGFVRVN
jgi:hypothetical protein